jgi:hypothetical protein
MAKYIKQYLSTEQGQIIATNSDLVFVCCLCDTLNLFRRKGGGQLQFWQGEGIMSVWYDIYLWCNAVVIHCFKIIKLERVGSFKSPLVRDD